MSSVTKKFFILLLLVGCSRLEQSEQDKLRRMNAKGEFIYRNHDEKLYSLDTPKHRVRDKYPWESAYVGKLKKITKEFFRCRGTQLNPVRIDKVGDMLHRYDCNGRHSLPIKEQKEFVYPILIELLNYVQEKLEKRVVITCGHRCPLHNAYADSTPFNQSSKHMIGAEVDFYVLGMEQKPEEVLKVLLQFYKENSRFKGKKELQEFQRYEKKDTNVSIPPWLNKEILIKIFQKNEGRDADNRHPYPYLSIQVRHDTIRNERVVFTWPTANNGYLRY